MSSTRTLYGDEGCPLPGAVVVALNMLKLDFKMEYKTFEELMAMTYNNLSPVMECEQGKLHGINSIFRHLGRTSKKLIGKNEWENCQVDCWLDAILKIVMDSFPLCLAYLGRNEIDRGTLEKMTNLLINSLSCVDKHLKNNKFLVGDSLTFPDVHLVCLMNFFVRFALGEKDRKRIPNVVNYYTRLAVLPEFVKL